MLKCLVIYLGLLISPLFSLANAQSSDCPDDPQNSLIDSAGTDDLTRFKKLLSCPGANINGYGSSLKGSGSALHVAIKNNSVKVLNFLIQNPAVDVNGIQVNGLSPIVDIVVNASGSNASDLFAKNLVTALNRRADFDPNATTVDRNGFPHKTTLLNAAELGLLQTIKELLKNPKTDINATRYSGDKNRYMGVITSTVYRNDTRACEIVQTILSDQRYQFGKNEKNENVEDIVSLYTSAIISLNQSNCKKALVKQVFADSRFDVNKVTEEGGWTMLIRVAYHQDNEFLPALLSRLDIDLNYCDRASKSAYDYAVENQHFDTAKILKDHGAKSCQQ